MPQYYNFDEFSIKIFEDFRKNNVGQKIKKY